jgi:plasmid maintenance system killer protein
MLIRSITHGGLRRFVLKGETKGLPSETVAKLRRMFSFLQEMATADELRTLPLWKAHRLMGDRAGTWALHVTANWRLTFRIADDNTITEVNLEDYH